MAKIKKPKAQPINRFGSWVNISGQKKVFCHSQHYSDGRKSGRIGCDIFSGGISRDTLFFEASDLEIL